MAILTDSDRIKLLMELVVKLTKALTIISTEVEDDEVIDELCYTLEEELMSDDERVF